MSLAISIIREEYAICSLLVHLLRALMIKIYLIPNFVQNKTQFTQEIWENLSFLYNRTRLFGEELKNMREMRDKVDLIPKFPEDLQQKLKTRIDNERKLEKVGETFEISKYLNYHTEIFGLTLPESSGRTLMNEKFSTKQLYMENTENKIRRSNSLSESNTSERSSIASPQQEGFNCFNEYTNNFMNSKNSESIKNQENLKERQTNLVWKPSQRQPQGSEVNRESNRINIINEKDKQQIGLGPSSPPQKQPSSQVNRINEENKKEQEIQQLKKENPVKQSPKNIIKKGNLPEIPQRRIGDQVFPIPTNHPKGMQQQVLKEGQNMDMAVGKRQMNKPNQNIKNENFQKQKEERSGKNLKILQNQENIKKGEEERKHQIIQKREATNLIDLEITSTALDNKLIQPQNIQKVPQNKNVPLSMQQQQRRNNSFNPPPQQPISQQQFQNQVQNNQAFQNPSQQRVLQGNPDPMRIFEEKKNKHEEEKKVEIFPQQQSKIFDNWMKGSIDNKPGLIDLTKQENVASNLLLEELSKGQLYYLLDMSELEFKEMIGQGASAEV